MTGSRVYVIGGKRVLTFMQDEQMEGDGVRLSVPKRIESYLVEVVQIHAMCKSSILNFLTADLTL